MREFGEAAGDAGAPGAEGAAPGEPSCEVEVERENEEKVIEKEKYRLVVQLKCHQSHVFHHECLK